MRAMRTALRGGLAGRRLQALLVGLVVLASATASTLGAGLLVAADAPFNHAFTAQRGADAAVTVNARRVSAPELSATTRLPEVTAAAGPFAEATVTAAAVLPDVPGTVQFQALTLAGRSSSGGPVDDIVLTSGRWPTAAGQIAVTSDLATTAGPMTLGLGQVITLNSVPSSPKLTVVGVGTSVTGTADGWVVPAELAALGPPQADQMLYRFASAGSGTAMNADVAALRRVLPTGAILGSQSWLPVRDQEARNIAPWVPFLVAFGVIGLVMSVLLMINVVSGAVIAGTRRIGVLKSVGFTPAQVVWIYVLQVAIPALAGVVLGALIADLLATQLISRTSQVLEVAPQSIPLWVYLTVPLGVLAVAAIATLVPASRAGRLSAVQAIATGRAPRPTHGYAALRLLGRVRVLSRPVTIGLATPFTRPGRTFVTFMAVLLGVVAVAFGVGLASSFDRVATELTLANHEHVQLGLPGQQSSGPTPGGPVQSVAAQEADMAAAIRAQPGTLHYVTESDDQLAVAGMAGTTSVTAFGGDASWIGYSMISGHWYGAGGAVVNTAFLNATGKQVGDTFTLTNDNRSVTLRITGEVFQPGHSPVALMGLSSVAALDPSGLVPMWYYVGLRPGVSEMAYVTGVFARLPVGMSQRTSSSSPVLPVFRGLIILLMLLLVVVAGLGVLNTVALMLRERVHDLGVFKAVGMTPGQTVGMVVTTVAVTGLIAGLIGLPAGIALQHAILPMMGNAAQTAFPAAVYNVYQPAELVVLALVGLVIATAGAIAPASWAARARTALALRAE